MTAEPSLFDDLADLSPPVDEPPAPPPAVLSGADALAGDPASPASARRSDPRSSHLTVRSIQRDGSMNKAIFEMIVALAQYCTFTIDGRVKEVCWDSPVTDDKVWTRLEIATDRRWQRNVIARARGLMESELGLFQRVPDVIGPHGRPVIAYIPTAKAVAIFQGDNP